MIMNTEFKTCITCHIQKTIDEFHKNPSMRRGRVNEGPFLLSWGQRPFS
jgi:hypothetical protein